MFLTTNNSTLKNYYQSTKLNHNSDSGFDVACPKKIIVKAKSTLKLNFEITVNNDNYIIIPRSSIYKTPLRKTSSVPNDIYSGVPITCYVTNISYKDYEINELQRLFQICRKDLQPFNVILNNNKAKITTNNISILLLDKSLTSVYNTIEPESCYLNLPCSKDIIIKPKCFAKIKLGIACQVTNSKKELQPYYLKPTELFYNTLNLKMANCYGIIDRDYTGELMVVIDNYGQHDQIIKANSNLFQLLIPCCNKLNVKIVDKLYETKRGSGGFGSTGK